MNEFKITSREAWTRFEYNCEKYSVYVEIIEPINGIKVSIALRLLSDKIRAKEEA